MKFALLILPLFAHLSFAQTYIPYPQTQRSLERNGLLAPKNISLQNPNGDIRNQSAIGSCASHGWLAMLENQMYLERGITLDLSERYQLFTNYQATKTMGSNTDVIMQFPQLIVQFGLMPETLFPYSFVDANAERFPMDAAQGLTDDPTKETVDKAIANTLPDENRASILQEDRFVGPLPEKGGYPVSLPVQVKKIKDQSLVPQIIDFSDAKKLRVVKCFSEVSEPAQLKVTPQEFLANCFDHKPAEYFMCKADVETALGSLGFEDSAVGLQKVCQNREAVIALAAQAQVQRARLALLNIIESLNAGRTVEVGVSVPKKGAVLSLWSSADGQGGGHAVVTEGYLTADDLQNVSEQSKGLLGSGLFDRLAQAYDLGLVKFGALKQAQIYSIPNNRSLKQLRSLRLQSRFGKAVLEEGGMIAFRNSWGAEVRGVSIGSAGYQAMTFKYFEQNGMLVMGRRLRVPASQPFEETMFAPDVVAGCPQTFLSNNMAWLQVAPDTSVAAQQLTAVVEALCKSK